MATYVLVHGGDRDGSIWDEVAAVLRRQGHQVFCPSMTPITQTSLEHNIEEICDVIIKNNLEQVILVAHSYGAMVITGVADKLSDKIAFMAFVDSVIPENGKSLYGMLEERGLNYQDFGLTPDKPCVTALYFDEMKFKQKPKAYIHCLQSEFLKVTLPFSEYVAKNTQVEHWQQFSLDAKHNCMMTHSKELADILESLGVRS